MFNTKQNKVKSLKHLLLSPLYVMVVSLTCVALSANQRYVTLFFCKSITSEGVFNPSFGFGIKHFKDLLSQFGFGLDCFVVLKLV